MTHNTTTRSPFIIFEGVDFTGKSTLSKMLVQALQEKGWNAAWYRSPGGSPRGEELREMCRNGDLTPKEQLRFYLEALQATTDHILAQPHHVPVYDRFTLSLAFYQIKELEKTIYGSEEYRQICEAVTTLNQRLSEGRKKPLLIVLDISEKEFEKRKLSEQTHPTDGRSQDRFDRMKRQQQHTILSYYHGAKYEPWSQGFELMQVDVNRPIDQIFDHILFDVEQYLK